MANQGHQLGVLHNNAATFDDERKKQILACFGESTDEELEVYSSFFQHVQDQTGLKTPATPEAAQEAVSRFEDALKIIKTLQEDIQRTKSQIIAKLQPQGPDPIDEENQNRNIYRAVRLWLLIELRTSNAPIAAWTAPKWANDQKLSEYIAKVFYPAGKNTTPEPDTSEVAGIQARLTHHLTAANITRYTDITIVPTNWLPDHLKFEVNSDYKILFIFVHKKLLRRLLRVPET
jgi:hypothetical protein